MCQAIVSNFFDVLVAGEGKTWNPAAPGGHSYATGGSNAAEHWFNGSELGDTLLPNTPGYYKHLGGHTEESCTQYNALKVARHLFRWSADAKLVGALSSRLPGRQLCSHAHASRPGALLRRGLFSCRPITTSGLF